MAASSALSTAPSTIVVIPARLASSRLPEKPLASIGGVPMIVHVWQRAMAADVGPVVVAAGDQAIVEAVSDHGGEAVLTDPDLPSGSDRITAALGELDPGRHHQRVINLQGDLPTIDPGLLRAVLRPLDLMGTEIGTLAVATTDAAQRADPNVVKAIITFRPDNQGQPGDDQRTRDLGRALYFTRATAPSGPGPVYHHIGIYAYQRTALERFAMLPPSPLERRERLEQLRALEHGMTIGVACVDTVPLGVDTPAQLDQARRLLG